ncbi:SLC5/6 family protein [Puniceicoccus vermicola]|uniref:Sodium:calcium symporter n=1 Tax=Puniceicoccus vermicola TaxID=388746 RepID=A0A7X1E3D3_9BACT|nr:sodium:calcium symporter [Puniceicoccus vermicola]MBC2601355.1 sodium:calcium symporter [Puniceicoccus vermicola]
MASQNETWSSRMGVILAVAGSAVGLGNFLRFPGQVAQYGGGSFMIAYFIAFLLIGLPVCWIEWTMGRAGGRYGFNSAPGIFGAICNSMGARFVGVIAFVVPVCIYMYYVVIEAWCLAYAVNYLRGVMGFEKSSEATAFFGSLVGISENGSAVHFDVQHVGIYFVAVFALNFFLIYRGISKGIEFFCKFAMPTLVLIALVILVRVLTLGTPDPSMPDRNVDTGLGFMWNPTKNYLVERAVGPDGKPLQGQEDDYSWNHGTHQEVVEAKNIEAAKAKAAANPEKYRFEEKGILAQLGDFDLWLAAAGQIFFSLSVGFGVIITYSSYLGRRDDVVLSSLAASSANEFCEVGIGGLISIPAGVAFFGVAGLASMGLSTFGVGFTVLPMVFAEMPLGQFFGFAFFFLLFLAAVTSSLSMLQPGIAYLEDAFLINRRRSVLILGVVTGIGGFLVIYYSANLKLLDTLDFWVTNLLMVLLALAQVILFGWVIGGKKGLKEAQLGSAIRIPPVYGFIIKYITPAFLLLTLLGWFYKSVLGQAFGDDQPKVSDKIKDLFIDPNPIAWTGVGMILILLIAAILMVPSKRKIQANINQTKKMGDSL